MKTFFLMSFAKVFFCALLAVSVDFVALGDFPNDGNVIRCEGRYGGHLQGVATDGSAIYWSFTVKLVKTDLQGRVCRAIDVPTHHGDLCLKDGIVYVAVNRGRFNFEDGGASEVRAYAASDLRPIATWALPMCKHGAGGMTFADDSFFVVGGLPATHERNYVYEFSPDFKFLRRHSLETGFTLMGIQTAAFEDGRFVFGIYGCPGDPPGSLECPRDLGSFVRRLGSGDVGILKLDNDYWTGRVQDGNDGRHGGCIVRVPGYPSSEPVYEPKKTGRGAFRIFFGEVSGWKDSGYSLEANGYFPLCNAAPDLGVFFPKARIADSMDMLPAVDIGGTRPYSEFDLVRAVRRVAETDEAFALHVAGTCEEAEKDHKLFCALRTVITEAKRLGVRCERMSAK